MNEVSLDPRVFEAPLLRGLDAGARDLLSAAARPWHLTDGQVLYSDGSDADSIYVVVQGQVAVDAIRRGDDQVSTLRRARVGDTVGEEAVLELPRRATARAEGPTRVVEFPAALFRRGAGRSHETRPREREARILARTATADLLRTTAATRDLPDLEFDMVLDAVSLETFERGQPVYRTGERADAVFLVVDGLVQLQAEDDESILVQAYLTRGDAFGHEELQPGSPHRTCHAVSVGHTRCLRIRADVVRTVLDRVPGLGQRLGRIASHRRDQQQAIVAPAVEQTTRHVFHDLYRMQMARSLLVIDPQRCVRCGHCAWSCAAAHDDGVSRLVRRGDKVVTRLAVAGQPAKSLLIPNSCQHCKNPACMVDCPTGAIGRDLRGEVFIREDLCTGCGNCAKACPWENIHLAPRGATTPAPEVARVTSAVGTSAEVAVKCDLCRGYDGPACVQACPTEAITRLDPSRDIADVAAVLGSGDAPSQRPGGGWSAGRIPVAAWLSAGLAGAGLTGFRLQAAGLWVPGGGAGALAGWTALGLLVGASAYVVPKRWVGLWHRRVTKVSAARRATQPREGAAPRSRLSALMSAHVVVGVAMAAAVAAHAGPRWPGGVGGLLTVVFWAIVATGVVGTLAYRWVPRRLGRLERSAAVPEDYVDRRSVLLDRLYKEATGRSDVVKTVAASILQPYSRSGWASICLLVSGRTLWQEQDRLRARIGRVLQGHGEGRLDGLDALIRTVVELRALPILRWGHRVLRSWLPLHIVLGAMLAVSVVAHVFIAVGTP